MALIVDDDAHTVAPVVVGEIAHDPDAGGFHFNDSGYAFGGTDPQDGDFGRMGNGEAVERNNFKSMSG